MNRLQEKYNQVVIPQLKKQLGIANNLALPKVEKIILNAGLGKSITGDHNYIEMAVDALARISGQRPIKTLAKQSISNFKIRKGMVVGAKVTLRGERMYAFLDKLINVALPRVRDFRGLKPNAFDGHGNYSIGFSEHIVFPEISSDEVEKIVGLEINIVTTAKNNEQAKALLGALGLPFQKEEPKQKK
ncbi:MAG: 50S ribosomal protein L5 [Candidatus Kerfeldbacteria bacterium RIFOXYA2_FULL_38_24]|uniref:Large ribosomal subunit protein uL5 n=1 Tax=Candidatus Kerfeldbacteria bacterium RIFOXYB2_FULL_38_14 TaxID=1798547 RepID=A0A1G2BHQ1_9BACT|nr:MAG: 50S ribosomal protein L5 [Candidatus Kerfeldbacteria bacterium RIFOXYB2_FULL_38_14]OGY87937.1 MAG: 50S ribosomal protein L5 [Candidatus Kerfeldbacteria bacterium RIFOXYA2_FULL_38_24]OGY88651.1 MAG: 50S ribosomal protein L5 [Candidatus Kerfeldbacteria bacterium RIFOXYC2_FULL_38_9]